ncbi:hypothetical protein FHX41_0946 [Actinomadura hallensis]|uniref:Uncharacterized protein n=1 Tax=Actinomadura hallensis TaxID=337895 RepID=A0A543I9U3_9ACTN|nr:hypothetical protein [Actinomadura hallensis]TQM67339.1 hypothetical protein FHX41_0946 [Actinomadura hallensis]
MKRIARAVTITGITMGAAVLAAPTAMADINIYAVDKAVIGHYGPTFLSENGPGNLSFSSVTGSPKASPKVGNDSVKTGDISTKLKGGKGNTVVNEIEGSEQDEGEGAAEASAEEASAEEGAAEEAASQQAQQLEAAPQEEAEAEEAEAAEAAPQEEAAQEEAPQEEAAQQEAAPQEEAAQQAQQLQAAPQEEAAQQRIASGGKDGKGHGKGDDEGQSVKHSIIGHNGPTLGVETGPGNLNFSSVTGSPYASPKVGNESVKTGDITTVLKGGKGNIAVNEVEGPEQDEGEGAAN